MSLSHREERLLYEVEEALWRSDPYLASMLVAFTMLTAGKPMLDHEDVRRRRWRTFAAWLAAIMRLLVQVTRASARYLVALCAHGVRPE
jgi:hypothetical protein